MLKTRIEMFDVANDLGPSPNKINIHFYITLLLFFPPLTPHVELYAFIRSVFPALSIKTLVAFHSIFVPVIEKTV